MTDLQPPKGTPSKILLATDLSARSDRALDRAVQLANEWGAPLVVVHALDSQQSDLRSPMSEDLPSWRRPPDPASAVEWKIRRDIRETVANLHVVVVEGDPPDVILEVARQEQCDLIVIGAARDQGMGRVVLGRTVEYLIRRAPTSVLVVKTRANGPYRHILVGTDFTDESRYGLAAATRLFPESRFAVMHAFVMPYRSFLSRQDLSRDFTAMEHEEISAFVQETPIDPEVRPHVTTLLEHGPPEIMMHNYAAERNADLTVIGTIGRGMLFHLLIGGNARKIVDGVPSDVLVVRFPDTQETA